MFNLQVGLTDGSVPYGRMLEYTDPAVKQRFAAKLSELQDLPTLSMPEVGDQRFEQVARIGNVIAIKPDGREHRFRFVPDPRFPLIPLDVVEQASASLGISAWELQRTHWAVKDTNLFEALFAHSVGTEGKRGGASPAVRFPTHLLPDPRLVGVMMPFSADFDIVYETIQLAAEDADMTCVRADDIWLDNHVMGDVLSILWRSRVIIADLTGRNANVFYEAGLAHALPRDTILLTQNPADVPFDLQSIRYLPYGVGTKERGDLRSQLAQRLRTLTSPSA